MLAKAFTEEVGIITPDGPKLMTVKEAEQLLVKPQDWQPFSRANWHKRATLLRLGMRAHLTPMAR